MIKISLIVAVICLLFVQNALSQPFWSTGPKIGYTFGQQGGLTGGWEFSYFPDQTPNGYFLGYTVDLTAWKGHTTLHFGVEGYFLDVGPTLFFSNNSLNFGMSAIAWIGIIIYPYYEFAWPFGQTPFNSVGGYIKIPVNYQAPDVG